MKTLAQIRVFSSRRARLQHVRRKWIRDVSVRKTGSRVARCHWATVRSASGDPAGRYSSRPRLDGPVPGNTSEIREYHPCSGLTGLGRGDRVRRAFSDIINPAFHHPGKTTLGAEKGHSIPHLASSDMSYFRQAETRKMQADPLPWVRPADLLDGQTVRGCSDSLGIVSK